MKNRPRGLTSREECNNSKAFFRGRRRTHKRTWRPARYVVVNQRPDGIYSCLPYLICWKCFFFDFHQKLTENGRVVHFPFIFFFFVFYLSIDVKIIHCRSFIRDMVLDITESS